MLIFTYIAHQESLLRFLMETYYQCCGSGFGSGRFGSPGSWSLVHKQTPVNVFFVIYYCLLYWHFSRIRIRIWIQIFKTGSADLLKSWPDPQHCILSGSMVTIRRGPPTILNIWSDTRINNKINVLTNLLQKFKFISNTVFHSLLIRKSALSSSIYSFTLRKHYSIL